MPVALLFGLGQQFLCPLRFSQCFSCQRWRKIYRRAVRRGAVERSHWRGINPGYRLGVHLWHEPGESRELRAVVAGSSLVCVPAHVFIWQVFGPKA